jgi:hypothetical protein
MRGCSSTKKKEPSHRPVPCAPAKARRTATTMLPVVEKLFGDGGVAPPLEGVAASAIGLHVR